MELRSGMRENYHHSSDSFSYPKNPYLNQATQKHGENGLVTDPLSVLYYLFMFIIHHIQQLLMSVAKFYHSICIPIGGTLDVTAHEILVDGGLKEFYRVTGGPFGGMKVNEEFMSLLERLYGAGKVRAFRTHHPSDWLILMNDFEMKKRGKRACEGGTTRIRLPLNLLSTRGGRNENLNELFANVLNIDDVKILNNEYLCLGSETMRNLFQPVISEIVRHLKDLLKKPIFREVKFLLLVGGFTESVILQEVIKKEFSNIYRILVS